MCNDCLEKILIENDFNWEIVNKICQYADIPFVPSEFVRLQELNKEKGRKFLIENGEGINDEYAEMIVDEFLNAEYEGGRHQTRIDMISAIEQGEM